MLYWDKKGGIEKIELFEVDPTPTEAGHNLADKKPNLAAALRDKLLAQSDLVGTNSK